MCIIEERTEENSLTSFNPVDKFLDYSSLRLMNSMYGKYVPPLVLTEEEKARLEESMRDILDRIKTSGDIYEEKMKRNKLYGKVAS